MTLTNRHHYGRSIIFVLIVFSIASMMMASVTTINKNNINNNNLLAFAKKKGNSPSSSPSSSSSSSTTSSTDHVKTIKTHHAIKKGHGKGKPLGSTDTTTTTPGGNTGTGEGVNGQPGAPGGSGGQGGAGGMPSTIPTPPPPPPPKPPKCKSIEILQGDVCIPKNVVNQPPTQLPVCKDTEVLKNGVCIPKQTTLPPLDCKLHPDDPTCKTPVDCTKTPTDPSCPPTTCDLKKDPTCFCRLHPTDPRCPHPPCDPKKDPTCFCRLHPTDPRCPHPPCDPKKDPTCFCRLHPTDPRCPQCPDDSTLKSGICQCPTNEHFNNDNKCIPDNIIIHVRKTIIIEQESKVVVHDFTEFTVNPTHSNAVILLPTQNIQDPTGAMHILGNIFNSGPSTIKNVGQVKATLLDRHNGTLAVLTATPTLNILKSQQTTSFQIIVAPGKVKLTDIAFIKFELEPIVAVRQQWYKRFC